MQTQLSPVAKSCSTYVYICNLPISGLRYSSGTRLAFTQTAAVVKTNRSRQCRHRPSQRRQGLDVIVFKRNPLGGRRRGLTPGHEGFINLLLPLEVPGRAGWRAYKRIEPARMWSQGSKRAPPGHCNNINNVQQISHLCL